MKKLLLGACIIFIGIFSAKAQLPYLQNFETSKTAMPVGWDTGVFSHHPGNPGWKFNNVAPEHGDSLWWHYFSAHTYYAYVDDVDFDYTGATFTNNTGRADYDTLYTSSFSCAAATSVFISFDYYFNNYTNYEVGTVAVSLNGGPWTTAITLPVLGGNVNWQNGQIFNLTSLAAGQANVRLAFCWNNAGAVLNGGNCGWGMAVDNINVYAPPAYDLSTVSQNQPYLMQVGKPYTFSGVTDNFGGTAITSMDMNYSVNGVLAGTQLMSGIVGFNSLTAVNWTMNTKPFTPTNANLGIITVKFWANNLNGNNADQNHVNDTLTAHFMVVDSIQSKMVMFEETSCASCNPCMYAMPNIDSVSENVVSYCNTIRYHWYFPGQDMINQETATLVNDRFVNYYGQDAVPNGCIDGQVVYPSPNQGSPWFSTPMVQSYQAVGSPFCKIDASATYTKPTQTFALNATIKSYGTFAAGLVAQVYLTEDSVDFKTDQSTEDPENVFVFDGGSVANSYYDYVLNFPDAVEEALPNANGSGTSLKAFTPGSTQTVSVSWAKNHPWAAQYKKYNYDSSSTVHMTIFIQDNTGNTSLGIPAKYVYQSKKVSIQTALGLEEISNGVSFNMYPNPTNNNATVAFQLDKDQNINVQVYNTLGQQVYSDNEGMVSAGVHTLEINGSGLKNGVYFVRFIADNATTTQKLIIQK